MEKDSANQEVKDTNIPETPLKETNKETIVLSWDQVAFYTTIGLAIIGAFYQAFQNGADIKVDIEHINGKLDKLEALQNERNLTLEKAITDVKEEINDLKYNGTKIANSRR